MSSIHRVYVPFSTYVIVCIAALLFCECVDAQSVCYNGLNCFDSNLPCNYGFLPEDPSKINTEFFLYTRQNPSTPQTLYWPDDSSITTSNFNGIRGTKFIIHGFISNSMRSYLIEMKDALLSVGDFNVILVDWEDGANLFDPIEMIKDILNLPFGYEIARQNTRLVGRQVGELSRKLQTLTGASFASMHLIGHSLGAQLAGFAGEHLSGQYGRITGLDPAGPGFETYTDYPGCLLEKSDSIFVDIIHTDGTFGNEFATGHQDFFPNGGTNQVSCGLLDEVCDHQRAVDYFTESITSSCTFLAYPCSSYVSFLFGHCRECGGTGCSRMGYYADLSPASGSFMLGTNTDAPYCRGNSGQPPSYINWFF